MASKYSLSVSLTEHLCSFIEAQTASGRFRTASEVIRAGLRLLEQDVAGVVPAASGATKAEAENGAGGSKPPRNAP